MVRYETLQAQRLSERVIFKPPLTVWYILIPVIFVYYFYRLNKYANGRKDFVRHYMKSRRQAIEAAADSVAGDGPPAIDTLMDHIRLPAEAMKTYRRFALVLAEHYADLLKAAGRDYEALVRSAYRTRGNYLIFLNRLGQMEKELDEALTPGLSAEHPAVSETIALIEKQSANLRRAEAERVFP
ncbi:MAG: NF038143 family protein [Desulfobacteraceae bacterium]